jgi:selenocysteine lyase/cysteine desulfurase
MNRTNARDFSNLTNYSNAYWPHAGRYNVGQTSNFILMPMMRAALTQIHEWGVENIAKYCTELLEPLKKYLTDLGVILEKPEYMSDHLFGLKLPENICIDDLKKNFNKANIIVSVRGSYLRVAVNVFNTVEDITILIESIEKTRISSASSASVSP